MQFGWQEYSQQAPVKDIAVLHIRIDDCSQFIYNKIIEEMPHWWRCVWFTCCYDPSLLNMSSPCAFNYEQWLWTIDHIYYGVKVVQGMGQVGMGKVWYANWYSNMYVCLVDGVQHISAIWGGCDMLCMCGTVSTPFMHIPPPSSILPCTTMFKRVITCVLHFLLRFGTQLNRKCLGREQAYGNFANN